MKSTVADRRWVSLHCNTIWSKVSITYNMPSRLRPDLAVDHHIYEHQRPAKKRSHEERSTKKYFSGIFQDIEALSCNYEDRGRMLFESHLYIKSLTQNLKAKVVILGNVFK